MKQEEIALLCSYIYNNLCRLEKNVRELQARLRFRSDIDTVDCIELALALQELETFKEVSKHIRLLLNIGGRKNADTDKEET